MNRISLRAPESIFQWLRIYKLYRSAFPRPERKPFSVILRQYRKGIFDVWCIYREQEFSGLVITMKQPELVLIDYLAISPESRGQGVGTQVLATLRSTYPGKGLFLEIESVFKEGPDQTLRQRRKQFYLRCGLTPMEVMVKLFGVDMELMGLAFKISYAQYHDFYKRCLGTWAESHISELPYPDPQVQTQG